MRLEQRLDRGLPSGPDQFLLQVVDTDEEPEPFHLLSTARRPKTGGFHAVLEEAFLADIAQSADRYGGIGPAEPPEEAGRCLGAADGDDRDPLDREITPVALGERLERDLVADPLDQHDRASGFRSGECRGGRRDRCIRTARVAIERFQGQLATSRTIHEIRLAGPIADCHAILGERPVGMLAERCTASVVPVGKALDPAR